MKFTYLPGGGAEYTTVDGDVVDLIAFNFYGTQEGTTEAVLEANPGLAAIEQPLRAGLTIVLPPVATKKPTSQIELWD